MSDIVDETLEAAAAGDSEVQRQAEAVALETLSRQMGVHLTPKRIVLSNNTSGESYVDDGVSRETPILVEVWAHQGPPRAAQRHKVLADAFKLTYAADVLRGSYRCLLCFTDEEAAKSFRGRSWYAAALRHHGIESIVVVLPDEWRQKILAAQARQYR